MQTQGDIGVFCGIGPGLLQCDLIEGQLFGAFTGDILKLDGALAQVFQRQAVHIMAGCSGVQHIGFQHGVKGHALHIDVVMRQYIDVVLGMLRHLGLVRIFQVGLECREHCVAIQLIGHAHIAVRNRDISGFVRANRQ